ncbi:hypothetical protein [Halovenus halobia]|uniref:hypothetical protein n=1 Tax=Halovenus halobia TaxID=3396622 RepID=UPI003F555C2E
MVLYAFTAVYLLLGIGLIVVCRDSVSQLVGRTYRAGLSALGGDTTRSDHAD